MHWFKKPKYHVKRWWTVSGSFCLFYCFGFGGCFLCCIFWGLFEVCFKGGRAGLILPGSRWVAPVINHLHSSVPYSKRLAQTSPLCQTIPSSCGSASVFLQRLNIQCCTLFTWCYPKLVFSFLFQNCGSCFFSVVLSALSFLVPRVIFDFFPQEWYFVLLSINQSINQIINFNLYGA